MNRLASGILAAFAAGSAFAASTFYVNPDPAVGSDDYDGLAAEWDGVHGPIRTLANITNLVTATAKESTVGDTVCLAEGDYDFGSDDTGKYRARIPAGTRLIGVGDRNRIRIFGSATDETQAAGDAPMRCLSLGDWVLVKHVTLCNGRATGNGGALSFGTGDFVVECVVSNNYTTARGGAFGGGTAIRCLFKKNFSTDTGKAVYATQCWNCVFDHPEMGDGGQYASYYLLYNATSYNCTFVGGGGTPRGNSHYNLLSQVRDSGNGTTTVYKGLFALAEKRSADGDGTRWDAGLSNLQLDGNYVPVPGRNAGVDAGTNEVYESKFPTSKLVADQKYLDFNGDPRIRNGTIDIGACETDPNARTLVIADEKGGLSVEGAAVGSTPIRTGESVTFRLSRDNDADVLCLGVNVNGEFFSFAGEAADRVYERTYAAGAVEPALVVEAVYPAHNDWYVDPVRGDDANHGFTKYSARKTLVGAMENPRLAAGDVVHASEGVYNRREVMNAGSTSNRVEVLAGVGLVAEGSAENTIIEGVPASDLDKGNPAGVRCVYLATGSYVKGFTLRNGSTKITGSTNGKGGGVYGEDGATAIDCVIRNCSAVRGGAGSNCALIRCRITDCSTQSGKTASGTAASPAAGGLYTGSLYDSYVSGCEIYDVSPIVNSFVDTKLSRSADGTMRVYNSYVRQTSQRSGGTMILSNCVYLVGGTKVFDAETSKEVTTAPAIDPETCRPVPGRGDVLLDRGDSADHVYPSAFASEVGRDLTGGQRVYNGQIDIGCGEYDWRGTFTAQLRTKGVTVDAAGCLVTTNELSGLVLSAGDTLRLKLACRCAGEVSVRVVADDPAGVVTVTAGGVAVAGQDGLYSFPVGAGESTVEISLAGAGTATLSHVVLPKSGIVIVVR